MQNYNNFGKYRYTFVSLTCFLTILWHFGIKFYVETGTRPYVSPNEIPQKQDFSCIIQIFTLSLQQENSKKHMSYNQIAQMELMNALNSINSELELKEFRDMLAHYFAKKAQKAIDALWDEGVINSDTIEKWGEEHMRTPYNYEANRS